MDLKELESYCSGQMVAEQLKEKIDTMRQKMFSLQSIVIDGQPRATAVPTGGKHEELICDYLLLIDDYENVLARLNTKCREIETELAKLPEDEQAIMREHYINGVGWEAIAERFNYSRRAVFYMRASALSKMSGK